jgi:hypothetical protein
VIRQRIAQLCDRQNELIVLFGHGRLRLPAARNGSLWAIPHSAARRCVKAARSAPEGPGLDAPSTVLGWDDRSEPVFYDLITGILLPITTSTTGRYRPEAYIRNVEIKPRRETAST